jgi:hypothetical protein
MTAHRVSLGSIARISMNRELALKIMLVAVGVLFVASG